jgi:glyoxylase-like metal-dependent hydrolase (beta-lactamase superfamily II)
MDSIVTLDIGYLGADGMIASFLAPTSDGGFVLFESGPGSSLAGLRAAVEQTGRDISQLRALFVTHIHLDHAGAAGELSKETGCTVHVHPKGAHHLVDPEAKLMPSARRIYGDRMKTIWGDMLPVPEDLVRASEHGEIASVDDLEVVAWHTPGHASHHIAWQVSGAVVTGDVAGARFPGSDYVMPPMPPPDIDVEQWRESLNLLRELDPERLLLTHFGPFTDVRDHLDQLEERILRWTELADRAVSDGDDIGRLAEHLEVLDDADVAEGSVPAESTERLRSLCPFADTAMGLMRYIKQRKELQS